jgi:hypothetical protein
MTAPDDSGLAERIASSTVESTYETRGEMLPEFPEGLERADDPDDLDFVTGDVGIPSVSELEYEAELRRLMAAQEEPEPEEPRRSSEPLPSVAVPLAVPPSYPSLDWSGTTPAAEPIVEDDWVSVVLPPQEDPALAEATEDQEEDPEHEDDWVTSQDAVPDAQMSSMERVLASLSPAVRRSLGLPVNDGES